MAYTPRVTTVPQGGTGSPTLTNHGVIVGQAAAALAATVAGNAGEVLTSNGAAADPTFQAAAGGGVTFPQGGISTYANIYYLPTGYVSGFANISLTTDRIVLQAFHLSKDITLTKLCVCVNSAGAAGAIIRLGIYTLDESANEFNLLIDAGTVAADAMGIKTAALSQALSAGTPYYLGSVSDSKGGTIQAQAYSLPICTLVVTGGSWSAIGHFYKNGIDADAALPTPITLVTCTTSTSSPPVVAFQIT